MSFLKKIFGKKPAPPAKPTSTSAPQSPSTKGISPDTSPKEVIQHIFQQLAASKNRSDVLADLKQRGFHSKTAEEYVALVEKTMFKR